MRQLLSNIVKFDPKGVDTDQIHVLHLGLKLLAKVFWTGDVNLIDLSPSGVDRKNKVSHVVRKPDFCICENKDADQLRGYREADQRLCFRYIDSTIPLLSKFKISSL